MKKCRNCKNELTGHFCSNCGQPENLQRIDGAYLRHEIKQLLNFEKGILFTIKELLIRPGQSIRNFISEDRNRLVKPVIFIIVCSLVYSLINQFSQIEESYVDLQTIKQNSTTLIFAWVQKNYGYANIIMIFFIALWVRLFFRKYDLNFFEIIIMLCYSLGIGMLIFSVFAVAEITTGISLMHIATLLAMVYTAWVIGQFFDKSKFRNYLKAFVAYFLGITTFFVLAVILGILADLVLVAD